MLHLEFCSTAVNLITTWTVRWEFVSITSLTRSRNRVLIPIFIVNFWSLLKPKFESRGMLWWKITQSNMWMAVISTPNFWQKWSSKTWLTLFPTFRTNTITKSSCRLAPNLKQPESRSWFTLIKICFLLLFSKNWPPFLTAGWMLGSPMNLTYSKNFHLAMSSSTYLNSTILCWNIKQDRFPSTLTSQ